MIFSYIMMILLIIAVVINNKTIKDLNKEIAELHRQLDSCRFVNELEQGEIK